MKNKVLIYSAFSGTYYETPEKDVSVLNEGQLPLKRKPSSSCSKCFGRGHTGRDTKSLVYLICSCVRKNINHDLIKKDDKDSSKG